MFNEDDYILFNGRQARIKKIGTRYTTFYMYDTKTVMVVPNYKVSGLLIEKISEPNPFLDKEVETNNQ